MKKLWVNVLLLLLVLSGCDPNEEPVIEEEYVPSYELLEFSGALGVFYEQYGMYYAGRYLDDGVHVLCLRDDAPEEAIAMAETVSFGEYSSSTVRLVKYSYADLGHVRLMVESIAFNTEALIYSIGINEMENRVDVRVDESFVYPDTWEHYVSEGVISIQIGTSGTFYNE